MNAFHTRCSSRLICVMFVQVKPSSNQVNLASCCVMPPDLTAFAKEFDIQLLTHNDSKGTNDLLFYFIKFIPTYDNIWDGLGLEEAFYTIVRWTNSHFKTNFICSIKIMFSSSIKVY